MECGDQAKSGVCVECEFLSVENAKELTVVHMRFIRDVCQANQWSRMRSNNLEVPELTKEKRKELRQKELAERERQRVYDVCVLNK
jgi:hypothetical protein